MCAGVVHAAGVAAMALLARPLAEAPGASAEGPGVREAAAIEAYNVPLFEVPPMLDVRSRDEFLKSHVVCAVSTPAEDGLDEAKLLSRILEHDDSWGWCLQHPFFVVYDETTRSRAEWLGSVLRKVVLQYQAEDCPMQGEDSTASRSFRLLRRLACQCKQILLLSYRDFEDSFAFCCTGGDNFSVSTRIFEEFGPLPRCALLQPRVFLAGRNVQMKPQLLAALGVTHVAVNGDAWDVMDGTSGGRSQFERSEDLQGVRYLKCDIPDRDDDPDIPQVLLGVAQFLISCADEGGSALVRIHGQSRTASAICAFVMIARGLSVEVAWRVVEEAGITIDKNLVWWGALQAVAESSAQGGAGAAAPRIAALIDAPA